ncbi:MAG: amidohydrolase [Clostridiales bacterium]|nr:amidohydrolase [Clostridiales bacterium]
MEKIDLHLHLSRTPQPRTGAGFISSYEEMLPHLDALGIGKGVLMSSGEHPPVPFGSNADNRAIADAMPDRYAWMCNLDGGDPATVCDRLARCKAEGAVGIGELMLNRRLDDPFLQAVFRAAGELGLPVTFHMSPEVGYSYGVVDDPGLPLLEQCLRRFPDTLFLGHSQTFWIEMSGDAPTGKEQRNQWGSGPVRPGGRVPELFARYPNLCGDLSANSAGCAVMRDPAFGLDFLETYADRLFFATDMVNTEMVFPLGGWLDEQAAAGRLSQSAYEKICRGNARRVFGLS